MNRSQKAWAHFDYWFNWHGHWMFADKEKAIKCWSTWGIDGLPDYPGKRENITKEM